MNVTIEILDHFCTQPEEQDCGEIIKQGEGATLVRKYVIRGGGRKIPALYLTRDAAVKAAQKQGHTVIE